MSRNGAASGRVRLADVASAAGVSAMTVSRVLREPDRVSPETRKEVLAVVRRLGYLPNANARTLASSRSGMVAAIVPTIAHSIYAATLQGLSKAVRQEGLELMVGVSDYTPAVEQSLVEAFIGRGVDALVLAGVEHTAATRKLVRAHRLPVAEIWDVTPQPLDLAIGFSNFAAGGVVGDLFCSLGRRRWAFVGAHPTREHRSRKRMEGFQLAAQRAKRPEPALHFVDDGMSLSCVLDEAQRVLANPSIDAVFCANDVIACGILQVARETGRSVPDAVAVVGFGDFDVATVAWPALTTIRIPGFAMGQVAGESLTARLRGDPTGNTQIDLGFELVRRASA